MTWTVQQINDGGRTRGPAAVKGAFVWVVGDQQHWTYRDGTGTVWDAYYGGGKWSLQQINKSGVTKGPATVVDPVVSVYGAQQHFGYADNKGAVWDSWYEGSRWNLQQINDGGVTKGPAAAGGVFVWVVGTQQHWTYRDRDGKVWDAYYDGRWNLQQVNGDGETKGPAAVVDPVVSVYGSQQHFGYVDDKGAVWDAWYDGRWNLQQINEGGRTGGPAAVGGVFVWVVGTQQHWTYRDGAGKVWDAWYDGSVWQLQQINLKQIDASAKTQGPAAASVPYVSVYGSQQHVGYVDGAGNVWDAWYDGSWNLAQINAGGVTSGPEAAGGPFVSVYASQLHWGYVDRKGVLWDSWWDPAGAALALGIFPGEDGYRFPSQTTNLEHYWQEVGRALQVVLWFVGLEDPSTVFATAEAVVGAGAFPMITLQPGGGVLAKDPNTGAYIPNKAWTLETILSGNHDAFFQAWATAAKAWGKPFFLRFAHEMNGAWYPWGTGPDPKTGKNPQGNSAEQYVAMWQYVRRKFTSAGATNAIWVWCPSGDPPTTDGKVVAMNPCYPGDGVDGVDWVGFDAYNHGGANWKSMVELYASAYADLTKLTAKPIAVCETSSTETGGDKATWIAQGLLTEVPFQMPAIKLVNWFDAISTVTGDDWLIDTSPAALSAFQAVAASPTTKLKLPVP